MGYFHKQKQHSCQDYNNNYFYKFYYDDNQSTRDLSIDALLENLQPRRGIGTFGRLPRSGILLRHRHLSPGGRSLLLAALWRSQLCRIQCLVEAGGQLQGDGQFWERPFPGGLLSEKGAMLNQSNQSHSSLSRVQTSPRDIG